MSKYNPVIRICSFCHHPIRFRVHPRGEVEQENRYGVWTWLKAIAKTTRCEYCGVAGQEIPREYFENLAIETQSSETPAPAGS